MLSSLLLVLSCPTASVNSINGRSLLSPGPCSSRADAMAPESASMPATRKDFNAQKPLESSTLLLFWLRGSTPRTWVLTIKPWDVELKHLPGKRLWDLTPEGKSMLYKHCARPRTSEAGATKVLLTLTSTPSAWSSKVTSSGHCTYFEAFRRKRRLQHSLGHC